MESHKVFALTDNEEKTTHPYKLNDIYKRIVEIETKISDVERTIEALDYELKPLKEETKIYKTFRHEADSQQVPAASAGAFAGSIFGLNTLVYSGSIVMGALSTAGVGALCFAAIMAKSYVDKNWRSPYHIEYKDVPFTDILSETSSGKLDILESFPEKGIFKAIFYPDTFSYSTCNISIIVKKEQIPEYSQRIQKINKERIMLSDYLQKFKKELADIQLIKDEAIKKTLSKNRNNFYNEKGDRQKSVSLITVVENTVKEDISLNQNTHSTKCIR
ncbi:MAG: hypothetical protein JO131_02550 [Gammaproteobacteria bacterium]|nr:hypothetical protein [Gammaproteobacteria bacterium]